MRNDLSPEHIKFLIMKPRQRMERDYDDHMCRARRYRHQAESLLSQARHPSLLYVQNIDQVRQSAYLAIGFAKDEINQAKALRG